MAGNRGRYYVVLVIERPGDPPGASYATYVEQRTPQIDGQLAYMQHVTAQMMSDLSRRVRRKPVDSGMGTAPPTPSAACAPGQGLYDDGESEQLAHYSLSDDDGDDETEDSSQRAFHKRAPLPPADESAPAAVGSKRPHAPAPRSGKPRQTEKTHLFVCTNPFSLMDELNAATAKRKPVAGAPPMHYYMGVAAGSFDYCWMAERYCTLWGSSSRGAGPRASWGDALKTVHAVGMYVDIGIVFGSNVPVRTPPPPLHMPPDGPPSP
jgi:hypothetical protein